MHLRFLVDLPLAHSALTSPAIAPAADKLLTITNNTGGYLGCGCAVGPHGMPR